MNRRGFFSALASAAVAVTGVKAVEATEPPNHKMTNWWQRPVGGEWRHVSFTLRDGKMVSFHDSSMK